MEAIMMEVEAIIVVMEAIIEVMEAIMLKVEGYYVMKVMTNNTLQMKSTVTPADTVRVVCV